MPYVAFTLLRDFGNDISSRDDHVLHAVYSCIPGGTYNMKGTVTNRYGSLDDECVDEIEKTFPDESKRLTAQLEKEYKERYQALKFLADQQGIPKDQKEQPVSQMELQEKGKEDPSCTISSTAEHSRADDQGEPCDDGRSGKI